MWLSRKRARRPSDAADAMRTRALCSMRACRDSCSHSGFKRCRPSLTPPQNHEEATCHGQLAGS